jgi:hypothetical protein
LRHFFVSLCAHKSHIRSLLLRISFFHDLIRFVLQTTETFADQAGRASASVSLLLAGGAPPSYAVAKAEELIATHGDGDVVAAKMVIASLLQQLAPDAANGGRSMLTARSGWVAVHIVDPRGGYLSR